MQFIFVGGPKRNFTYLSSTTFSVQSLTTPGKVLFWTHYWVLASTPTCSGSLVKYLFLKIPFVKFPFVKFPFLKFGFVKFTFLKFSFVKFPFHKKFFGINFCYCKVSFYKLSFLLCLGSGKLHS